MFINKVLFTRLYFNIKFWLSLLYFSIIMNSVMRQLYFFTCLFLVFSLRSQNPEGPSDCTYSKEIIIPFNYQLQLDQKPLLNQTVFYTHRDQFSYWYKIIVKEESVISFEAKPINDSDGYAIYVYQYNHPDFCDKLYYQKMKPMKSSFFLSGSAKDPDDLSLRKMKIKKDQTYYISVLNTSINNCGHVMTMVVGNDTLRVKAVHFPCQRSLPVLATHQPIVEKKQKAETQEPIKTDSIKKNNPVVLLEQNPKKEIQPVVPVNTAVKEPLIIEESKIIKLPMLGIIVLNSASKKPLDLQPVLMNVLERENVPLKKNKEGKWEVQLQKGVKYKVKASGFGYKEKEKTFTYEGEENMELLLDPLKVGDNFVMKSIYFYPNTYALKKESEEELQKLLNYLKANENVTIEIQGHTNGDHRISKNKAYASLGEEWNFDGTSKKLSQKRAEAIKIFLESNGIPAERLQAKGFGGSQPIIKDPETNEEGQMNIRVEVEILKN